MIKYIIKIIIFLIGNQLVLPIVLSIAYAKMKRQKWLQNALGYIVEGALIQLAIFYIVANISIRFSLSLRGMFLSWMCVGLLVGCLCLIYIWRELLDIFKEITYNLKFKSLLKIVGVMSLVGIVMILARFTLLSDPLDDTIEKANISYATNTIANYNPYTGDEIEQDDIHNISPAISMYYSIFSYMLQIAPNRLIRFVFSYFVLLLTLMTFLQLGKFFWCDDTKKQRVWILSLILIYCIFAICARHTGFDLISTTWNGTVIWNSIILPIFLWEILSEDWSMKNLYSIVIFALSFVSVSCLTITIGLACSVIIIATCILISIVRRLKTNV